MFVYSLPLVTFSYLPVAVLSIAKFAAIGSKCLINRARLYLFLSYKYCIYFIIQLDAFIYF